MACRHASALWFQPLRGLVRRSISYMVKGVRMSEVPPRVVNGIDIHTEGDHRHAIVMLHGWPDSFRLWDATVAALVPLYR